MTDDEKRRRRRSRIGLLILALLFGSGVIGIYLAAQGQEQRALEEERARWSDDGSSPSSRPGGF